MTNICVGVQKDKSLLVFSEDNYLLIFWSPTQLFALDQPPERELIEKN